MLALIIFATFVSTFIVGLLVWWLLLKGLSSMIIVLGLLLLSDSIYVWFTLGYKSNDIVYARGAEYVVGLITLRWTYLHQGDKKFIVANHQALDSLANKKITLRYRPFLLNRPFMLKWFVVDSIPLVLLFPAIMYLYWCYPDIHLKWTIPLGVFYGLFFFIWTFDRALLTSLGRERTRPFHLDGDISRVYYFAETYLFGAMYVEMTDNDSNSQPKDHYASCYQLTKRKICAAEIPEDGWKQVKWASSPMEHRV